jgi:hypothetical protein
MGFNFDIAGITPRDVQWVSGAFNFSETIFGRIESTTIEGTKLLTSDGQTLLDANGNYLLIRG